MHSPAHSSPPALVFGDPDLAALFGNLTRVILGGPQTAEMVMVALLARGHVLLQGPPGIGKTTLAKTLARSIDADFKRVQFTPDLLPADILGYSIYDQGAHTFVFHPGPVFSHILLADEINRTTPRVQSALLEAMNENQVSVDGVTRPLPEPFFVVATQNATGAAGTFPLPDSQLDRFLLACPMTMPDAAVQAEILCMHQDADPLVNLQPVLPVARLIELQTAVLAVAVAPTVARFIVDLAEATRHHAALRPGVSTRAAMALMRAAQARACMEGRTAVYPDDVKILCPAVFAHRLGPQRRRNAVAIGEALAEILAETPVP